MKTLTPVATYGSNPTYPEDGVDPETAAGLEVSIQTALNRSELVKTRIDAGVQKVRTVATIAALKGVTGHATGDHAVVKDMGVYEFDGASVATSNDVTVVTPTVGGGRWLLAGRSLGVANGFAALDATAKVAFANLRGVGSVRAQASVAATQNFTSPALTSDVLVTASDTLASVTGASGDWGVFSYTATVSNATDFMIALCLFNGSVDSYIAQATYKSVSGAMYVSISATVPLVVGTNTLRVRMGNHGTGGAASASNQSGRILLISA